MCVCIYRMLNCTILLWKGSIPSTYVLCLSFILCGQAKIFSLNDPSRLGRQYPLFHSWKGKKNLFAIHESEIDASISVHPIILVWVGLVNIGERYKTCVVWKGEEGLSSRVHWHEKRREDSLFFFPPSSWHAKMSFKFIHGFLLLLIVRVSPSFQTYERCIYARGRRFFLLISHYTLFFPSSSCPFHSRWMVRA